MPLLTEADPPRKRRVPVALLILAIMVLLPVGVFGWSCHRPVSVVVGSRGIGMGRIAGEGFVRSWQQGGGTVWYNEPDNGFWAVKLPGGQRTGWYIVLWIWQ